MFTKTTEGYLENAVRAKFMEFPTPFLTQGELGLLQYIAREVMIRSWRNAGDANYEVTNVILKFTQFFVCRKRCYVSTLQQFCLWLQFFMNVETLTYWERHIILLMFLQCKWFIKEDKIPSPGEQEGENSFMYGQRLSDMKDFRKQIERIKGVSQALRIGYPELKNAVQKVHPTLYRDMQNAYREGRTILQNAANINALNSVMTATKISPKHEEFAITGTHSNHVHHNSEGLIRGFIRNGEVKSVQPVYSNGENTLFHSHSSLSPISRNSSGNPKVRVAGDIGHSYYGKKNIFAINSDGDIFYTNPQLAGSCIDFNDCAESYYGQVYLGNIKEFMK